VTGPGRAVQVTLKLFASLGQYLPQELGGHARAGNQLTLELAEDATVQAVIDRFALPRGLVHLVLVNGAYLHPAERAAHRLQEGDALAIWPPIAGG